MFLFDMPREQLESCLLPQSKEPGFDAFWERMLGRSKEQPLNFEAAPRPYLVPEVEVRDLRYAAFDGGSIAGWSITPRPLAPRPTLVFFHGYSGNKTQVHQYLLWAMQGFTCLAFDVRGQSGESTDGAGYPGGHSPGFITQGLLDPEQYYFTRCYLDAVRALDAAQALKDIVDISRLGTTGCSQGGGLSLAACALDNRPRLCMAEVPGFCHFRRTLEISQEVPWTELIVYFRQHPGRVEKALRTLSYVELNNLTERIHCPVLANACQVDAICIPSSIYSAINRVPHGEKHIEYFPFNGHEGGLMMESVIAWARKHLLG